MTLADRLPSWEAVVHQAGDGKNPFQQLLGTFEEMVYPKVPNQTFGILLGFAGVYLVAIFFCVGLLLIPFLRDREARKGQFWLYKKQYLFSSDTPYYIFNSRLSQDFARKAHVYAWLPGYFGFHVTAFGSLYTYLCSPRRIGSQLPYLLRPAVLNTIFFVIPILVVSQTVGWCFALFTNARTQNLAYLNFLTATEEALDYWAKYSTTKPDYEVLVLSRLSRYLNACDKFIVLERCASAFWAIIGLLLAIFYAGTVAALIRLVKSCIAVDSSKLCFKRTLEYDIEGQGVHPLQTTLGSVTFTAQPSTRRLKEGYVYLVGHCSVMLLCLLLDVAIGISLAVETERAVTDPKWRPITSWITLVGSCFVTISMLIHSWRISTERDTPQARLRLIHKSADEEEATPSGFIVANDKLYRKKEFRTIRPTEAELETRPKHTSSASGLSQETESGKPELIPEGL
ncbi:hypothetical protein CROQUDRAFT_671613 [Cronartium quercuum f. sp. fusiforme G11]|uniref:Uncharacterized protein n=1 Tax=Cronartium quercuum f. sp. fusiforme G11 TaxID=708437 RepID=A0A9P6TAY4_9BASI|nr:hypothetical protein CROQUDRAFT_671613 [Cronartium quercuum f. sp. fusiforme G11]